MKHLKDNNNPSEFISSKVQTSQKIDGSSLYLEKTSRKVEFYGREKKTKISKIIRASSDFYEDIFEKIESFNIFNMLKEHDFIQLEFFSKYTKPIISNNSDDNIFLIDTSLNREKVKESLEIKNDIIISDYSFMNNQAKELILSKLNHSTFDDIKDIIKNLNNDFKLLVSNEDIEGLVFKNHNESYKLVNSSFTDKIKEKKQIINEDFKRDIFTTICSFDLKSNQKRLSEEDYIKTIEEIFLRNIDKIEEKNVRTMFSTELNDKYISNDIIELCKRRNYFKEIFRCLLLNLNRVRKRRTRFLSEDQMKILNKNVIETYEDV